MKKISDFSNCKLPCPAGDWLSQLQFAMEEGAQAQLDSCEKEHKEKVRGISEEIDNILNDAVKESTLPSGRKLEYFFVVRLIALKQKHLGD